jgi:SAM-dependent methyltransferase
VNRLSRFDKVSRDWTRLGETDPLWAVHVVPDKRGGRWDPAQFLATGEAVVSGVMAWLDRLGLPTRFHRVLDFGCGAGRLTQALAGRADSVVGVDVAEPMLAVARDLDPAGRCEFVHNDRADLRAFADGEFDLVFSELVLQHLPRPAIDAYLAEFLRVLRSGGLGVLHTTTSPLWTVKGMVWRFAPGWLVRAGQRVLLRYPAPMRMTAVPPARVRAVVEAHGGSIVDTQTYDDRAAHWRCTRYVLRAAT